MNVLAVRNMPKTFTLNMVSHCELSCCSSFPLKQTPAVLIMAHKPVKMTKLIDRRCEIAKQYFYNFRKNHAIRHYLESRQQRNMNLMNLFALVYAFSEQGKNDFKIKSTLQATCQHHDHYHDHDDDTDDYDEDSIDSEEPDNTGTPGPQFFQINKEEVVVLANDRGSQIYLLGTNHASPESRMAVDSLIKAITPHIVVVELCKTRIGLKAFKTFERNRNFNLYLLRDAVSELGISAGFIWYSMAYMERFISRLLNVDYGGDMRAPGTSASFQVTNADLLENKKNDYKIMLGDRPIEVTIKRMASILTFPEKAAIWFFNICSAVLGLRCYLLNVPTVLFRSPKFNHVLLDERDVYLTYSLQMAAALLDEPARVIGIVGKAHVPGIINKWNTITEDDVKRVTTNEVSSFY